jgi:hypothetical protein
MSLVTSKGKVKLESDKSGDWLTWADASISH